MGQGRLQGWKQGIACAGTRTVALAKHGCVASVLSNLRPRRAQDGNRSNDQQPEWKYPDAGYRLQDQPRQKQPLPAQRGEQQHGSHDIDRPPDRRGQARESTDDVGYTSNDEGQRQAQYRELERRRSSRLG